MNIIQFLLFLFLTNQSYCQSNQVNSVNTELTKLVENSKNPTNSLDSEELKDLKSPILSLESLKSQIIQKGKVDSSVNTIDIQESLINYKSYVTRVNPQLSIKWIKDSIIPNIEFLPSSSSMIGTLAYLTERQSKISEINSQLFRYKPKDTDTILVRVYFSFIVSKNKKYENVKFTKIEITGCFESDLCNEKLATLKIDSENTLSEVLKLKKLKKEKAPTSFVFPIEF